MIQRDRARSSFNFWSVNPWNPRRCKITLNPFVPKVEITGGVENSRLEAKAKAYDTKKSEAKNSLSEDRPSRGQGQECSRLRTKDTAATVLKKKKKKGFQKRFSGDLQFIDVLRIFGWGRPKPQIACNDVIKIFQKGSFCGTKIS